MMRRNPSQANDQHRNEAHALGDLLQHLVSRRGLLSEHKAVDAMRTAWLQICGEELAKKSRVVSFRSGRLTVEVDSAARCHLLSNFDRERLLCALQAAATKQSPTELRFRVGSFE